MTSLLERSGELAQIQAAVSRARQGSGTCLLIEGPAGAGKSALLSQTAADAAEEGFWVLRATGRETERDFSFGVVIQLLAGAIEGHSSTEREALFTGAAALARPLFDGRVADIPGRDLFSFLHGLHWLVTNLSGRQHLVLVIDDAHWADSQSLAFIDYLAHRIDELNAVLVVGIRSGETDEGSTMTEGLVEAGATRVRPRPLSSAAVGTLLVETIGDDRLTAECARVTRGNPLFVRELIREIAERGGVEPGEVRGIAPGGIARVMLARFRTMEPADVRVAEALAVLAGDAGPTALAALTGEGPSATAESTDRLIASGLVVPGPPLALSHPILERAVYESLSAATKSQFHLRAARHLGQNPSVCEHAAAHLLAVTLAPEDAKAEDIETLIRAADRASARGASGQAVRFLERALVEQLEPAHRREILIRLGREQTRLGRPDAVDSLEAARLLSETAMDRAEVALAQSIAQTHNGALADSVDTADAALAELPARGELRLALEAQRGHSAWVGAFLSESGLERLRTLEPEALVAETAAQRQLLAVLAIEYGTAGARTAAEVGDLADRAWSRGQLLVDHGAEHPSFVTAVAAKTLTGGLQAAEMVWDSGVRDARARGSLSGYAGALLGRAYTRLQLGRIEAAEADAVEAATLPVGEIITTPLSLATAAEVSVERGGLPLSEAAQELRDLSPEGMPVNTTFSYAYVAVGWLALRHEDPHTAHEHFLAAGDLARAAGWLGASCLPWRSGAALALMAMDRADEAREFVDDELLAARSFGALPALGIALRTKGRVEGDKQGLELTQEAVEVLARSDARLEHARALIQLGELMIDAGNANGARARLREGIELAFSRGAKWTVERGMDALRASGARPRRPVVRGPQSLSAQERQTVVLAAQGMSNREIAEALFVTLRTVEAHLTSSYRKLDITSRRELASALSDM